MLTFVKQDDSVLVSNGFWECRHEKNNGGAIASVKILNAGNVNILSSAISCRVMCLGSFLDSAGVCEYRDDYDARACLQAEQLPSGVIAVKSSARLLAANQSDSGIRVETEYTYRMNRISVRRKFVFGPDSIQLNRVTAVQIPVVPELDHWTARKSPATVCLAEPAIQYQTQCGTNFPNLWGKFNSFITEFYEWRASSQLAIYTPDGAGIELMPDGDINQWDRSFEGTEGYCGYSYIKRLPSPRRHVMGIDPYFGDSMPLTRFTGEYLFDFELSLPNIASTGFNKRALWTGSLLRLRRNSPWVTREELKEMADNGVQVIIHHHDNPHGKGFWPDESFYWPTGVFPPYDDAERAHLKALVDAAHEFGMKIIPYFNLTELHDSCCSLRENFSDWTRLLRGRRNHSIYGYQTCLRSGFAEFLKNYIREVIEFFNMDGAYFDGSTPGYCENPRHGSPHYTVQETLGVLEYTRSLVGRDGIIVIHNSGLPWLAAENLADQSVFMEYVTGFPNFEGGVPDLDSFDPMTWYGNVVSHSICGYTAIRENDPDFEKQYDKLVVECILNGICFKGISLNAVNEYQRYKRLSRMMKGFAPEEFRFEGTGVFPLVPSRGKTAAYISRDTAYVVVGNPESEKPLDCSWNFLPEHFGWKGEIQVFDEGGISVDCRQSASIPGYSYLLFKVQKQRKEE